MKIKCPHCKNTYVIDHVELRDREKCPKCNKVIFVELFKKPFDKEGTSSIKKLLYGGTTAALVILAVYFTNFKKEHLHQKELFLLNKTHLEENNSLKKEFDKESKRKADTVSQLENENLNLLALNRKLGIKLETQQCALSELIEAAKIKEGVPATQKRPVEFFDENLKKAVEENLGVLNPTAEDMLNLIELRADEKEINYLTGLQYAKNLSVLSLPNNTINNLIPISELSKLENLNLWGNPTENLSPLANLSELKILNLGLNRIEDIYHLSELKSLEHLNLCRNRINDISVISNLTNLIYLHLGENEIEDISALSTLKSLETLDIHTNKVEDISAIFNLENLKTISINDNKIKNVNGIENMRNLKHLAIQNNQIKDPRPILRLKNIEKADINGNLFSQKAIDHFNKKIKEIIASR